MNIKSNSVAGSNNLDAVNLPNSISIGSSIVNVFGNVQTTGVVTTTTLNSNSVNTTTISSPNFIGNGSQLTNITTTNASKVIALKYILSDPPLRS